MNFELIEDQEMTRRMVRDFAEKELKQGAEECDDREEILREIFDKIGELGLTGISWPEQYGGGGCDHVNYVIAIEELSRIDASTNTTPAAHTLLAGCRSLNTAVKIRRKISGTDGPW
jgi:butyryl-CoA dehydrogenase